jgi:uroporphyrinogen-III synthase
LPGALDYLHELEVAGFETLCAPMLEIKPQAFEVPDLDGLQGLVFTSRQGVRYFAEKTVRRDIAVYCVGAYTAMEARACGFEIVHSAEGAARDLAAFVRAQAADYDRFLYVRGVHVMRDLAADLEGVGLAVSSVVVYRSDLVAGFSAECVAAMKAGAVCAVVFFSKRTARNFMDIVEREGLSGELTGIKALCISAGVVECVRAELWREVKVSPQPDRRGMFDLLQTL